MNKPQSMLKRWQMAMLFAGLTQWNAVAHVHLQVSYTSADGWRLFIRDFDSGEFDPATTPLVVSAAARVAVPDAPAYTNLFGAAGTSVWILPETETPDALYLGIGTEGGAGSFVDGQIRLRLESIEGPGDFVLYNVDAFGGPLVHMNTRDGVLAGDSLLLNHPGGHVHVNWAFTAPGTYRIGFSAAGLPRNGAEVRSATTHYTFLVRPPPAPRLSTPRTGTNGQLNFSVLGEKNVRYRVEASADLQTWHFVTNVAGANGDPEVIGLETRLSPARFYRAVRP